MGRSTRKISGYSSSEIKALFKTEDKYKIGIRLYAVYQISLGKPSRELEVLYNTSFKQILNWASRFEKEGIEGLRDKKGRGRKSKLTDAQKEQLKEVVLKKSPENYGYNTSTWNGPLLIDWLNKHMGVFYQRAQIYNVLKSLGLTYQKSKGFYPEADKEKQSIFKETLKKKLLESPIDTVLLFEDEFSLSNTATLNYQWSIQGKQPQVSCKQKRRERQTGMGSYNYETGQITVSFHDRGNYQSFKKYLKKVLRCYREHSKIIMVVDNVRFHHAKLLKKWLLEHPKLEIVYLPPYSPELNPVERAWWYMRKKITHNRFIKSLDERKIAFWKMFSHFQKPNLELLKICETKLPSAKAEGFGFRLKPTKVTRYTVVNSSSPLSSLS